MCLVSFGLVYIFLYYSCNILHIVVRELSFASEICYYGALNLHVILFGIRHIYPSILQRNSKNNSEYEYLIK